MTGLKENQLPMELLCERKLREAKQQPDPYALFSLQLMRWFLQEYELAGPWKDRREDLQRHADKMLGWDPEVVQNILFRDNLVNAWMLEDEEPGNLGMFLAENLNELFEDVKLTVKKLDEAFGGAEVGPQVSKALKTMQDIAEDIKEGKGLMGKLLGPESEKLYARMPRR